MGLNQNLLRHCSAKGLTVLERLDDLSDAADAVTLIDSFYYFPNPREVLLKINERMKEGGVVVIRITDRNLYTRVTRKLLRRRDLNILGDVTVGHSLKSLKKLFALTGFELLEVIPDYGRGKSQSWERWVFYRLTCLASCVFFKRLLLTPGILVACRKVAAPPDVTRSLNMGPHVLTG